MENSRRYRISVVEPSEIIAGGLVSILGSDAGLDLCGVFQDYASCSERLPVLNPDLIIISATALGPLKKDIYGTNSFKFSIIPHGTVPVIVLQNYPFPEETLSDFSASISLYDDRGTILKKIRQCVSQVPKESALNSEELTQRETGILISVAKGLTNKQIADKFNLSIHTVISHRKNISRKTGIKTVSGMTVYAILNGLIDIADDM